MLLAMYPHLLNNRRMIGSDHIRTEPEAAVEEYADMFGNRCARLQAPPGATTLWSDCIVEDTGEPDEFNWNARQHEIVDLPVERWCRKVGGESESWRKLLVVKPTERRFGAAERSLRHGTS